MTTPPCVSCGGRRYRRTAVGWQRCASCWVDLLNETYIKPMVRQGEVSLPEGLLASEPWPLKDRVESGPYPAFRRQVWRSLLHWSDQVRTYEYLDAWALNEIHFERATSDYKSLRDLQDLDLLVVVMGLTEPPNSTYVPHLVKGVVTMRTMQGRPTWVYRAPQTPGLHPAPVRPDPPRSEPRALPGENPWDS